MHVELSSISLMVIAVGTISFAYILLLTIVLSTYESTISITDIVWALLLKIVQLKMLKLAIFKVYIYKSIPSELTYATPAVTAKLLNKTEL